MKKFLLLAVIAVIVLLDQWTKHLILSHFSFYQPYPVLSILNITLAYNTGAAFSFLSRTGPWHTIFFTAFGIMMITALSTWLFQLKKEATVQALALSLIIGGALGNLIDRLQLGFVVDFINFHY